MSANVALPGAYVRFHIFGSIPFMMIRESQAHPRLQLAHRAD